MLGAVSVSFDLAPRWRAPSPEEVFRAGSRALALGFLVVVATTFAGCPRQSPESTLPLVTTENPDAEAAIEEARETADRGESDAAEALYQRFLSEHPDDPLSVIAELEIGRIRLAAGDLPAAAARFANVATHEDVAVAERGRFYGAVTAHLGGEHARAIEGLQPFVGRTVAPEETALLLETLAAASNALARHDEALGYLDLLVEAPIPEDERQAARRAIRELVAARLDREALGRLFGRLDRNGFAWRLVGKRALRLAFEAGDLQHVLSIGTALGEAEVDLEDELRAMILRAERTGRANPRAVGALLPLSGRGREVGQAALQAIFLGAGLPLAGPPNDETPQVPFRDSGTSVEDVTRAVDDLVTLHQVIAIIGPLEGARARAAAARATELGVPLISLSPDPSVPTAGERVFRLFMAPEDEARALAEEAHRRGAARVSAFLPEGGYGDRMSEAFAHAASELGLELAEPVRYPADASELRPALERLARRRFDALLLGDSSRNLSIVAPGLAASGFESLAEGGTPTAERRGVHLLISSVGAQPGLIRSTGRYLQGAVFSQPFHAPSATGAGRAFADAYEARYGRAPDAFAAAAFDAHALIRSEVAAGANSREALSAALRHGPAIDSVGPSMGLSDARGPRRGTRLYTLRGVELQRVVASAE